MLACLVAKPALLNDVTENSPHRPYGGFTVLELREEDVIVWFEEGLGSQILFGLLTPQRHQFIVVACEASDGFRKATEYEYHKRVLNKVKKRLCRSTSKWNQVLPIDYFYQYEFEQGSHFKPVPKANSPHHIHGLFPVQKEVAERIYNFQTKEMDARLVKDLKSMKRVSTFLIEPLRTEESKAWLAYMLKGKPRSELTH